MPYTIKTQQIAVKDPDTGEYSGVDVLAEQTTEGLLNEIEVKGTTVKNEVDGYIADARDDIDQLETDANTLVTNAQAQVARANNEVDTLTASITSAIDDGVDRTLTRDGVPADAKATGDAVSDLKSALDIEEENISIGGAWSAVNNNVTINKVWNTFSFSGTHNGAYRYVVLSADSYYASNDNETGTIPEEAFTLGDRLTSGKTYLCTIKTLSSAAYASSYDLFRIYQYINGAASNWKALSIPSTINDSITYVLPYNGEKLALILRLKSGNTTGLRFQVIIQEAITVSLGNSILRPIKFPNLRSDYSIAFNGSDPNTYYREITSLIPLPTTIDSYIRHNGNGTGDYSAIVFYDAGKNPIGNGTSEVTVIPNDANYFRLSNMSNLTSEYEFQARFAINAKEITNYLLKLLNVEEDYYVKDLLADASWRLHYEISPDSGEETYNVNSNYSATDFIALPDKIQNDVVGSYAYTGSGRARLAFYNEAKSFLSGYSNSSKLLQTITIPEQAKYIKCGTHMTVPTNQCKCFVLLSRIQDKEVVQVIRDALVDE